MVKTHLYKSPIKLNVKKFMLQQNSLLLMLHVARKEKWKKENSMNAVSAPCKCSSETAFRALAPGIENGI